MKPFIEDDRGLSSECGLVLDALSAQLGEPARHVETSVTRLCESFANIARRTKENAANASRAAVHAVGDENDAVAIARRTIAGLLGRMDQVRRASDESVETLWRIEAIATRVDRIQHSLGEVDTVPTHSGCSP